MTGFVQFSRSSIGAKAVQAVTGILLLGFVVAHLVGNLAVFGGPDALNTYAAFLKSNPQLLWPMRLGLLAVAITHVGIAVTLHRRNEDARPTPYAHPSTIAATTASLNMMRTGVMIAAYAVFHLAHFTWGFVLTDNYSLTETITVVDAAGATQEVVRHDVYSMLVRGFEVWWISVLYIAAMLMLASHLRHGVPSFFQTIGWNHPRFRPLLDRAGIAVSALIAVGYISIPVACWLWLDPAQ